MQGWVWIGVIAAVAACKGSGSSGGAAGSASAPYGGSGDACERYLAKSESVMEEIMGEKRVETAEERASMVEGCRKFPGLVESAVFQCVLAAPDRAAVKECVLQQRAIHRHDKPEPVLAFAQLETRAKAYFAEHAALPTGAARALPLDRTCCGNPSNKCPAAPAETWAADPVWGALDFAIDGKTYYRYAYQGAADGQSFHATAVADIDCDGVEVTYVLDGKIDRGALHVDLTPPTNPD